MLLEGVDVVSVADDGLGDVPHRDAARGLALLAAAMGVPVQHEVRAAAVDRLCQQVTAEEGIDFEALTYEGLLNG